MSRAVSPLPYRPELDTIYWGAENFEPLIYGDAFAEQLRDARSVAIDIRMSFRRQNWLVDLLEDECDSLQSLSLVLPDSTGKSNIEGCRSRI